MEVTTTYPAQLFLIFLCRDVLNVRFHTRLSKLISSKRFSTVSQTLRASFARVHLPLAISSERSCSYWLYCSSDKPSPSRGMKMLRSRASLHDGRGKMYAGADVLIAC